MLSLVIPGRIRSLSSGVTTSNLLLGALKIKNIFDAPTSMI